ncbi:hypothetical protein BLA18112_07014 [Burkholderia lata]|uniref:Uncharacterized protein n=1 Tax=Burkholderia lata (strain ATCC 17760 / DSM 23089 / LMG 22485 / NCIMB 9086 / R18194 / 383) TaxID=482957 RepID=A0A6P3ABI5_BURL3|nr:hypothetical protein BLA18112_07014 [Burkholderia lata]
MADRAAHRRRAGGRIFGGRVEFERVREQPVHGCAVRLAAQRARADGHRAIEIAREPRADVRQRRTGREHRLECRPAQDADHDVQESRGRDVECVQRRGDGIHRDDRRRVAREHRRIRAEIAQEGRDARAQADPRGERRQEQLGCLRKRPGQQQRDGRADRGAENPVLALRQAHPAAALRDDPYRRCGPFRVVEIHPEGDIQREERRGGVAQREAEGAGRQRGPCVAQRGAHSRERRQRGQGEFHAASIRGRAAATKRRGQDALLHRAG